MSLKDEIYEYAADIGLDLIGVTDAEPFDRFLSELDLREDDYTKRYSYRLQKWRDMANPKAVIKDAASVIVVGFYYYTDEKPEPGEGKGVFARIVSYGHLGILLRTRKIRDFLKKRGFRAEMGAHRKEAAVRAGLGAIGKNDLVINPEYGSWVAYQSIITNAALEPDKPFTEDLCGTCDLCIKACPTQALYEPYRLNPQRCIAYLLTDKDTSQEYWSRMQNYILGCDHCLNACPKNRNLTPKNDVDSFFPFNMGIYPPLEMLLKLDEETFQNDLIAYIQNKIMPDSILNSLMKIQILRKMIISFSKTFLKGKEKVPETFVHASGNLNTYKRNAIIAAANTNQVQLKNIIAGYCDNPELKECAKWAISIMEKENG